MMLASSRTFLGPGRVQCQRVTVVLAVAGLGVLANSQSLSAAPPLVALAGKATATVCATCDQQVVRLPVTTRDDLKTPPSLAIDSVEFRGSYDRSLTDRFSASWHPATGRPIALVITVDPSNPLTRAGVYDVAVGIASADATERAVITLSITRPAGSLATPAALHIDRTVYVPYLLTRSDAPAVGLTETSKASNVTVSAVTVGLPFVSGARTVIGDASCTTPLDVPIGQTRRLTCTIDKEFPFGVSTSTAQLHSDQLAAPLPLTIEVRSRLSSLYILLAAAIGLLVSWLVKVRLQEQIDLAAALERADRLKARLTDLRAQNKDAEFAKAIAEDEKELETAINRRDAAEIEAKRVALDEKVNSELQLLSQRRAGVAQEFQKMQFIVGVRWSVPAEILEKVRTAAKQIEPVTAALQVNDVVKAKETLIQTQSDLAAGIALTASTWVAAMTGVLRDLADGQPAFSKTTQEWLAREVEQALTTVRAADPADVAKTLEEIEQRLSAVSSARRACVELLSELARRVRGESIRVRDGLDAAFGVAPEALAAVTKSTTSAGSLIQSLGDRPESWADQGPQVLQVLARSYRNAILGQLDEAGKAKVEPLVQSREYESAAAAAARIIEETPRERSVRQASVPQRGEQPALDDLAFVPMGGRESAGGFTVVHVSESTGGSWPRTGRHAVQDRATLNRAKAKQTFAIGGLICVFAVSLYAPSFIGTWAELSGIFFWAFGLDLTLDAVLRLKK